MSEKLTIIEALAAVMGEVQPVGKGSRNVEFGYNFRGIDAVVNAVGPILRKHCVIVVPELLDAAYRDVSTSKGKPSRECTVRVRYRFYGPAGDYIDAVVPGESMDVSDKGAPKAMSVAYRIALLQTLCIPTDEPDPDSQSYERGQHRDEWETAAKPPTETQAATFESLSGALKAAELGDLMSVWDRIVAAFKADEITTVQANALRAGLGVHKAELEAKRDGTNDTQPGGGLAREDVAGAGNDGGHVGGSGPGRDGEAGGVRPGVQPSVHRGDGAGGAAQASRGHRGAPAAPGGRRE